MRCGKCDVCTAGTTDKGNVKLIVSAHIAYFWANHELRHWLGSLYCPQWLAISPCFAEKSTAKHLFFSFFFFSFLECALARMVNHNLQGVISSPKDTARLYISAGTRGTSRHSAANNAGKKGETGPEICWIPENRILRVSSHTSSRTRSSALQRNRFARVF